MKIIGFNASPHKRRYLPDPDRFQTYYDYTKDMFQLLEFDVKDMVVIAGTRSESAAERKELHIAMKEIGSSLAAE